MAIEFTCPECKANMRVPDMHAGRKGMCPACRKPIVIPAAATSAAPAASAAPVKAESEPVTPELVSQAAAPAAPASAPTPSEAPKTAAEPPAGESSPYIKFTCPGCGKMTGFPVKFAGTPMNCPSCKVKVMVPDKSGEESFIVGAIAANEKPKPEPKYKYAEPAKKAAPEQKHEHKPVAAAAATHAHKPAKPAQAKSDEVKIPVSVLIGGMLALGICAGLAFIYLRQSPQNTIAQQTSTPVKANEDKKAAAPIVAPAPETPKETAPKPEPAPQPSHPAVEAAPTKTPAATNNDNAPDSVEIGVAKTPPRPETPAELSTTRDSKSTRGDDDVDTSDTAKKPEPKQQESGLGSAPPVVAPPANQPAQPAQPAKPVQQPIQPAPAVQNTPKPPLPPTVCSQCMGTGFLPLQPARSFIQIGPAALNTTNAASSVPWRYCTKCGAGKDPQALLANETTRIGAISAATQQMENATGLHLLYAETHHVAIRTTIPESETRQVVAALDDLTQKLQQMTSNTVLTQTRPDTHDLLIAWDDGGYKAILTGLFPQAGELAAQSKGFTTETRGVFNANHGIGVHPKHMALYEFASMLVMNASSNRAPVWLKLGFAAYAENLVTHKNYVYAFVYEKNEVKFGDNWDLDIKKFASQGKLKTWDQIFPVDAIGMKSLDYLTIYSMVEFMMVNDPKQFTKLCLAFRDGMNSEQAIEKTYGRDYKQLQQMWAQWALTK
jgi:hypothetical protein